MMRLILILLLVLMPVASLAGWVTLPYENTFTTQTDLDNAADTWGDNECQTWTLEQGAGFDGSPVAVSTFHNCGQDVQGGLGEFHWASQSDEANHTSHTNVGFLAYFGSTYPDATGDDQKIVLFLDNEGARPKMQQGQWTEQNITTFAPCSSAGGHCYFADGSEYPTLVDTFKIEDYLEQWVWIEYEVIQNTSVKLYIYTQDGVFSGLYLDNVTYGAEATSQYAMQHLFAYWADDITGVDSNSYVKLDNLNIAESFIGPPTGFLTGDINGDCGASDGATLSEPPTSGRCLTGTAGTVTLVDTTYSWDCSGIGDTATDDSCTATYEAAAQTNTGLPFTSSFELGDTSEWVQGGQGTFTATTTGDPTEGSYAVYAPLTSGTNSDNYRDFIFGDHVNYGADPVDEVWLEVDSKFNSGYTWPDNSQKIIIINLTDGLVTDRRYQVIIQVNSSGEYVVDNTDIGDWIFNGNVQNRNLPASSVRFDEWDNLKLHAKLNDPGSANGEIRLWVNDVLKIEYTDVDIRESTSYNMNKLILSTYATTSSGSDGTQWHDNVSLYDVDPDWFGTTPVIPEITTVNLLSGAAVTLTDGRWISFGDYEPVEPTGGFPYTFPITFEE